MSLVLGMILDAVFGEPRAVWNRVAHPAVLIGRAIKWCDDRFNGGDMRRIKGGMVLLGLLIAALTLGWVLQAMGWIVEMLVVAVFLAQKSLIEHVRAVADGLRLSLADGRFAVGMIVGRDTGSMDTSAVARGAIESAAENFSDGVLAPVFWFLLAGLPGLLAYKVVNTADSMIGYRNARYAHFGWAAARLDDLLNLIPARLTGLAIAALSGQLRAWPAITADAQLHRSPNAGWPEAAMARALDVALAGPRSYDGQMRDLAWVNGDARHETGPDDIDDAVAMLWRVWGAAMILVIACAALNCLF